MATAEQSPAPAAGSPDPREIMRQRSFIGLLVIAAVVGVIASLAAWLFLEAINLIQDGVYDHLPDSLGFDGAPWWWPLPPLVIAGVVVAFAIARLPGRGGHIPAEGLNPKPTMPRDVPGVLLAALAGIGLGVVLGPEAPLMAIGGGLGYLIAQRVGRNASDEVKQLIATCGVFAGLSFLFGSPLIAAVIVIEAAAIGGPRMPLILVPGLVAAGIGMLVSVGLGSWTGVSESNISLALLPMPDFPRPDAVDFLWSIPLAAVVAVGAWAIFAVGRSLIGPALKRPYAVIPVVGAAIAGLAIAFEQITDKGASQVLFSGQDAVGPLVGDAGEWAVGTLLLLILCKGIAYAIALGSFRGGPVFPAIFIATAAGLAAAHLPGFETTPAVAVAMGAAVVAVLRLPLSAAVLATLLTSKAGLGAGPLVIVAVAVGYVTSLWIDGAIERRRSRAALPQAAT
jgi:H+/Cl- antiporter ClcA